MPKQTQQPNPNDAAQNMLSQMVGQQLEAEEQMPPQQVRMQNQSSPKPLPPMGDITIGGNNFSPSDVEHLVTTAQEPPTGFQNEVQAELDRLAQARASRA